MLLITALLAGAAEAQTTNRWISAVDGKWEASSDWSGGVPSSSQSAAVITNGTSNPSLLKTVTIDQTTVGAAPGSLTISNLFMQGGNGITNTLLLSNTGSTALNIITTLAVSNGGSIFITNATLNVANQILDDGVVTLNSGSIVMTNAFTGIGYTGVGSLTISNGTWLSAGIANTFVAVSDGSVGTLTIAGGTTTLSYGGLAITDGGAKGTVWLTGGRLNTDMANIAFGGPGQMTVSNGTWVSGMVRVCEFASAGTLTIAGGNSVITGAVQIAANGQTTGTVWITGGRFTATNDLTSIGYFDMGQVVVSNGTWLAQAVQVGNLDRSQGTLTIAGGTSSIYSNLTMGGFNCSATGTVLITGGEIHITNDPATAVLEVRSGTLIQTGGLLDIDRLVVTNPCAHFIHTGGTLIIGLETLAPDFDADGDGMPNGYEQANNLDPLNPMDAYADNDGDGFSNLQEYLAGTDPNDASSALRILGISKVGNTVTVTWQGGRGVTNVLESAPGDFHGGYTTNFATLSSSFETGSGLVTNTFSESTVTNSPLYFRARLIP
jgi:hypothetical protein